MLQKEGPSWSRYPFREINKKDGPDDRCFLAAWAVSKSVLFRTHCQQIPKTHYSSAEHRRSHYNQDERFPSPRYAVWGTRHPTAEDPLHWCREVGATKLPTSWVSFKQEAWPCHVCPRATEYTLLDQSPPTSKIKCLYVDVHGSKIVNVYKPPLTQFQSLDLPMFTHPCLYAGDFNCRHADWGYDDNSPDGECLAGWASINCLALLYNAKDAASFYSGRWNTATNPDLAFASIGPNSRLPDRHVLDKFPGHNFGLRLLHHQGLLWQCQACLLSDGTSARPNGVITLLWRINSQDFVAAWFIWCGCGLPGLL